MATQISKLEDSFARSFTGKILKNMDDREVAVPVFLDYPDLEEAPDQRFPSISILFTGLEPDTSMYDTQLDYEESVDYTTDPPTFTTRRAPEYYRILYDVTCFSLSAREDRALFRWIESRHPPRHHIMVDDVAYHLFREGFNSNDSVDVDTIVYEKTWSFVILADIEDTDNDSYQKGVKEIRLKSNLVRTSSKVIHEQGTNRVKFLYNTPKSADSAEDAEKILHRTVAFDDQKFWFNPKN